MTKTQKRSARTDAPEFVNISPAADSPAAAGAPGPRNAVIPEILPEDAPRPTAGTTPSRAGAGADVSVPPEAADEDSLEDGADILDVDADDEEGLLLDDDHLDAEAPDTDDAGDDGHGRLPLRRTAYLPSPAAPRDSLQLYLREVSRFPLLKPEEEHDLAVRVRDDNDPDAAFRLVSSHLRLVVRIAMDFQRRWMQNVLDLVQEGNVGLMRAVHKFDPDKGIKFSYYASFWIKAYILKFIMDNWRMVKIGTTQVQRKLFYNLNRERQKLIAQGFDPDAAMLSERLGVSEAQVNEMDQRLASTDLSLNVQVGDEGGATRMDFLPALDQGAEERLASAEVAQLVRAQLKTILPKLNDKEQYILRHRLLTDEPVTLREIGERYNITRERVRQLEARLLEKIGQHITLDVKDFSPEWIQS
ncbi:RNA polymerase sigma factor RpoD/SigA [uncultured Desulfovibrio sp.]|uniref:sigma-70 family RNA polymerase sigma factor n=3 Tax=uncultured Desulfovibrio sp. TaxID=167968 RepID=UPI0025EE9F73|nr:RNA polymerase factor sigma-32 [uncultured Desulfovibrio sp.]